MMSLLKGVVVVGGAVVGLQSGGRVILGALVGGDVGGED